MLALLVRNGFSYRMMRNAKDKCVGLNIGADKEAAEHFLSALALQESSSGEKSEQLWFTLRRALLSLVRTMFSCCVY